MARPKLSEDEKRIYVYKTKLNLSEKKKLFSNAGEMDISVFIRERILDDRKVEVIASENKKVAAKIREIHEAIKTLHLMYLRQVDYIVQLEKESEKNPTKNFNFLNQNYKDLHNRKWRAVDAALRDLNAQLLGYADDDN